MFLPTSVEIKEIWTTDTQAVTDTGVNIVREQWDWNVLGNCFTFSFACNCLQLPACIFARCHTQCPSPFSSLFGRCCPSMCYPTPQLPHFVVLICLVDLAQRQIKGKEWGVNTRTPPPLFWSLKVCVSNQEPDDFGSTSTEVMMTQRKMVSY